MFVISLLSYDKRTVSSIQKNKTRGPNRSTVVIKLETFQQTKHPNGLSGSWKKEVVAERSDLHLVFMIVYGAPFMVYTKVITTGVWSDHLAKMHNTHYALYASRPLLLHLHFVLVSVLFGTRQ